MFRGNKWSSRLATTLPKKLPLVARTYRMQGYRLALQVPSRNERCLEVIDTLLPEIVKVSAHLPISDLHVIATWVRHRELLLLLTDVDGPTQQAKSLELKPALAVGDMFMSARPDFPLAFQQERVNVWA